MDQRYRDYARLILNHSLKVQPGELVVISCDPISVSFGEVLAQEIVRSGAHFHFWFTSPATTAVRLLEGTDDQLDYVTPCERVLAECDCHIALDAPHDYSFPKFDPERVNRRRRANACFKPLQEKRWVVALLPTQHLADQMGITLAECESLVFQATVSADWGEMALRTMEIQQIFRSGSSVRIVSEGTDLRFSLPQHPGVACVGRRNLPDGEHFFAPLHESVEGTVTFYDPQITPLGRVSGIRLTFKEGKVVEAAADEGQEVLDGILATDEGARYLGEFGIGVNPLIQRIVGSALFDEKIAGTVHLALGSAYAAAGGVNKSLVHWDLILDLRRGGVVYLDGRLVCLDGHWLAAAEQHVA